LADLLPQLPTLPAIYTGALDATTNASGAAPSNDDGIMSQGGQWIGSHLPFGDAFKNYMNKTFPSLSPGGSASLSSITWGRVAAFLVGLLLIGGAVLLFKENVSVVQAVSRTARRATTL